MTEQEFRENVCEYHALLDRYITPSGQTLMVNSASILNSQQVSLAMNMLHESMKQIVGLAGGGAAMRVFLACSALPMLLEELMKDEQGRALLTAVAESPSPAAFDPKAVTIPPDILENLPNMKPLRGENNETA